MLAWTKQNTMQRAMRTVLEWPKVIPQAKIINIITNKYEPQQKHLYIRYFHICSSSLFNSILYLSFIFYLFMFVLYNCLFTFNNLHLYSIFVHYYSISVYLYSMFYICIQ